MSTVSLLLSATVLLLPSASVAQTLETSDASFNGGYGRYNGQENRIGSYTTRDSNNNRVIVDGMMMTGVDQSYYNSDAAQTNGNGSGVGSYGGYATAVGNSLTVITQGNNNTVIVDSVQTNTGDITATTTASQEGN